MPKALTKDECRKKYKSERPWRAFEGKEGCFPFVHPEDVPDDVSDDERAHLLAYAEKAVRARARQRRTLHRTKCDQLPKSRPACWAHARQCGFVWATDPNSKKNRCMKCDKPTQTQRKLAARQRYQGVQMFELAVSDSV